MDNSGFIVVGLLIGFIIIVGIWMELVEKPKENREKNRWIQENEGLLNMQDYLVQFLNGIGDQLPPCEKCNSIEFQLWEVINQEITIRCTYCKKKYKHQLDLTIQDKITNEVISVDFVEVLTGYINLVELTFEKQNTKLGEYLKNHLVWDFFNLRKGTIIYRGITFNTNPNFVPPERDYEDIKNDEPSRRISQRVMDRVWNRDGGKCVQCGSNEKLEFDHIIPFSKGGSNGYRNIQLLCESCNRSKSDKIG